MFDHISIEQKWRAIWDQDLENGTSAWLFSEQRALDSGEKSYLLDMFPYPSGSGLHVGHVEEKVALDIYARFQRMQGKNVLMPTGYDSFGLPTENYALKNNLSPQVATEQNTKNFHEQTKRIGISYDWSREFATSDPEYYKFTQWWFKFLYERGLAYRKKQAVNWCPQDQTVLANEQVIDGRCERCDSLVEQKEMEQWFFRITEYAERLLSDLDKLDWPDSTKQAQRNWIGKSTGITIDYPVLVEGEPDLQVTVFTTRPDTNFGASFIAVAPESHFVRSNLGKFPNKDAVETYVKMATGMREIERTSLSRVKTGVNTGLFAVNNLNGKKLPIFVSDFVLGNVGTGALVGVPGHDIRDFEFAQTMGIEIIRVVVGPDSDNSQIVRAEQVQEDAGHMINSDFLDGLVIMEAKEKMMDYLEAKGWGKRHTNFKLRDWSISRQRYWGAPIPIIYKTLTAEQSALVPSHANKPQAALNFHAWGSAPSDAYHAYVDKALNSEGLVSMTPELPNSELPILNEWLTTAESTLVTRNITITDNLVVTGRSLGAWAALKFAQTHKLRKLILVCPTTPEELQNDMARNAINAVDPQAWEHMVNFVEGIPAGQIGQTGLDIQAVRDNVSEIVVFLSTNDQYIPLEATRAYFRENFPFARLINVRDAGHFTKETGYSQFPQLLREILAPVRLDIMAVNDADLPVNLPNDVDYRPKGQSPLATSQEFNSTIKIGVYGSGVRREVDTMDTFVCSSWYFFRFLDTKNDSEFASSTKINKIGPVDFYIGGAEHTVLHLLYSRFFTKVAFDAGIIDFDEPFLKLRHQGIILGPDNRKMSKRWGNVINPNDVIDSYGADTLRMYEMFMGPLDQTKAWNDGGVRGIHRFLQRVYGAQSQIITTGTESNSPKTERRLKELVIKVESDIGNLKFNTAISEMMKFINFLAESNWAISLSGWKDLLLVLHPFAPFLTSELWEVLALNEASKGAASGSGNARIDSQTWPEVELSATSSDMDEEVVLVIMVNGKLREQLKVPKGTQKSTIIDLALKSDKIAKYVSDSSKIKKEVFVPDKLLNLVTV